jgi:hypothetical protein
LGVTILANVLFTESLSQRACVIARLSHGDHQLESLPLVPQIDCASDLRRAVAGIHSSKGGESFAFEMAKAVEDLRPN